MYRHPAFAEDRSDVLYDLMDAYPLCSLIRRDGDGFDAHHLPLFLDRDAGLLLGHVAKANPLAALSTDIPVLAIFTGPQAYISPSFYPSKIETGRVVPTWNYQAVHVHGLLTLFTDPAQLRDAVTRLTDRHEADQAHPWAVSDAPPDYIQTLLAGIVGLRITMTRLEGKTKMSQNRTRDDRAGVAAALNRADDPVTQAVGRLVAKEI